MKLRTKYGSGQIRVRDEKLAKRYLDAGWVRVDEPDQPRKRTTSKPRKQEEGDE